MDAQNSRLGRLSNPYEKTTEEDILSGETPGTMPLVSHCGVRYLGHVERRPSDLLTGNCYSSL